MKKTILLTFILFRLVTIGNAFDFHLNQWTDFEGTLGKAYIQLSLFATEKGQLKGNYCYFKYERKIPLIGQITGDKIVITEFLNGKPNGHFEGRIFTDYADRIEGTWTDSSGARTAEFELTLQAVCGNDFDHRYSDFSGNDDEVEKFMKHVKTSILKGDKEWISNHMSYPLKTTINSTQTITITNKKQLIENFDLIFHKAYKDRIQSFCVCNMFNNTEGIMLGNGEIWINYKWIAKEKKSYFVIIAINN